MTHKTYASEQGDRRPTLDDLVAIMRKAFAFLDEAVLDIHERDDPWADDFRRARDEIEEGLSWVEEAEVPR